MRARSALFDLYGDYLRPHGHEAPVAALVRLLAPLGIAAPAVRTAVSRMVRQGWLLPVRLPAGPGYALSQSARRRLDEAVARIYRTRRPTWDGRFDLLVVEPPGSRSARGRLHQTLAFLGYGSLGERLWVSPRPSEEADAELTEAGVRYHRFSAIHTMGTDRVDELVAQAWDLPAIAREYDRFVAELTPVVAEVPARHNDEAAYRARFRLVHAWRSFLFRDPYLPPELLPTPWAGATAAEFFDHHAGRLRPAADRFVARCLP